MVKIYQQPFAHAGTKQAIPDASDPQGFVSNEDGFTTDYELPDTDPNYKPIERAEFNGLMNMVTESLGEIQQFGFAKWQPITWPQGARAVEGGVVYRSLVQTSQQPPHADWVVDSVQTSGDQTVGGIKTFSSFPVTPSAAPTANYQAANKKYVDDSAIGVGQTWQDVKGSRVVGTTYTNTTGKPIMVNFLANQFTATTVIYSLYVDDILVSRGDTGTSEDSTLSAIVPDKSEYSVVLDGPLSGYYWAELR